MIKILQILVVNLALVFDTSGVLLSRDHSSDLNSGSAWSFSLSGSSAKGTARRNQVNEQSGLYAEEGGYHVYADNVHLKGGVIASTSAENSELATNRFTFEDIQNESASQATSLSGSVGMSRSSDTLYDKNGKAISNPTRAQYADKTLKREKGETSLTGGIGIPLHESQTDSSLTKATLTEGKITLNKDSQSTQTTAKELGINTELKNANKQVENTLNLDRTLQEQKAVQTAVANLQEATETYIRNKRKEAQAEFDKVKQQHDKNSDAYKTAEAAVKAWEIGGKNKQNIDTVTAVVSTVLAGSPAEQIAVAALSPTLNNQIHALTKDDNSKVTNILAHAVLGAIEAKAAGVNGASGAVAAAGAEIIAHTLAEQLYGVDGKTKTIDDLTQEEKQNLLTLSQLGSAIAGGMAADSGYAAGVSGEIGKRAVENNALSLKDVYQYQKALKAAIQNGRSVEEVHQKFKELSEKQRADLLANCDIECRATVPNELLGAVGFADELSGVLHSWLNGLPLDEQTKFYQLVEEENAKTIEALKAQQTDFEKGIELAMNAAHLLAKEDINNSSNKRAIYNPKQTRAKIEDKFGEHNVKSTTVVQNARSTVTERTLKTGESVQIIQSEGGKAVKVYDKPDQFGNRKEIANIPYDDRGLPIFDNVSAFTTKIEKPNNHQNISSETRRLVEMRNATLSLKNAIQKGEVNVNQFTKEQLQDIYNGNYKIQGFTWHHNAQSSPNNMQLLPENIHNSVKHIGEGALSEGR